MYFYAGCDGVCISMLAVMVCVFLCLLWFCLHAEKLILRKLDLEHLCETGIQTVMKDIEAHCDI